MDAIDLTKSDSDEDVRLVKRQRTSPPDDEVQVVEKPDSSAPAAAGPEPALGDEDLLITGATGPVRLPASSCGRYRCSAFERLLIILRRIRSMHQHWIECLRGVRHWISLKDRTARLGIYFELLQDGCVFSRSLLHAKCQLHIHHMFWLGSQALEPF